MTDRVDAGDDGVRTALTYEVVLEMDAPPSADAELDVPRAPAVRSPARPHAQPTRLSALTN